VYDLYRNGVKLGQVTDTFTRNAPATAPAMC